MRVILSKVFIFLFNIFLYNKLIKIQLLFFLKVIFISFIDIEVINKGLDFVRINMGGGLIFNCFMQ